MIQATDNQQLQDTAGRLSATQFIQDQLRAADANAKATQVQPSPNSAQVSLSDASKLLGALQKQGSGGNSLLDAISSLVQQLTGKKVSAISLTQEKLEASSFTYDSVQEALKVDAKSGVDYRYQSVHAQGEQLNYSAQGGIKLEDGTQLSFDFRLQISRITVEETRAHVRLDGAKLREALGSEVPGGKVQQTASGVEVDLDHHGVHKLLEDIDGARQTRHRHGHHRHERNQDVPPAAAPAPQQAEAKPAVVVA